MAGPEGAGGTGKGSPAAGGSSVFLLALCWCRSSRGNKEGWTELAVCPRQTGGSSGMGCANKAALSLCPGAALPPGPQSGPAQKTEQAPLVPGSAQPLQPPVCPCQAQLKPQEPLRCSQDRLGLSLPCCSILHSCHGHSRESSPHLHIPLLTVLLQLWRNCCCFHHCIMTHFNHGIKTTVLKKNLKIKKIILKNLKYSVPILRVLSSNKVKDFSSCQLLP